MCSFYMLIGFPGSGKTNIINDIIKKNDYAINDIDVLCRDSEVIKLINAGVGKNNSRSRAHDYIMDRIKNPQKKIIFYDSVNGDSLGRKAFLDIIPNNYIITLIYFEPATLIIDKKYEEYVDWLHSIRLSHHIFPSNKKRLLKLLLI